MRRNWKKLRERNHNQDIPSKNLFSIKNLFKKLNKISEDGKSTKVHELIEVIS